MYFKLLEINLQMANNRLFQKFLSHRKAIQERETDIRFQMRKNLDGDTECCREFDSIYTDSLSNQKLRHAKVCELKFQAHGVYC